MSEEFKFRALTPAQWEDIDPGTGLTTDEEGKLILARESFEGTYTSSPLDSGIENCTWHRVALEAFIPENSTLTLHFFTSNKKEEIPAWWGETFFKHDAVTDALLYVKPTGEENNTSPGRYLTVKITFNRKTINDNNNNSPLLSQVKIYYPRLTYLRYLPAIYSENKQSKQFLERFLSLFETMWYDNETATAGIPGYFDPFAAPKGFLPWLASWVSLDWHQQAPVRQNREFIRQAVELYKKKGTPKGLADLVYFLTGQQCCIKEYYNNVFRSLGMDHDLNHEKKTPGGQGCAVFYRRASTSVNTADKNLLANMGTYFDEVHYTTGAGPYANYGHQAVGIFINLPTKEAQLEPPEEVLEQIIAPFLPVFVRAEIKIVRSQFREFYNVSAVQDVIIRSTLYSYRKKSIWHKRQGGASNDLSYGSYNSAAN